MTDLFVKPTDTHQFLDTSSSHPYHCKKGIPYSQVLRLNRICSDNEVLINAATLQRGVLILTYPIFESQTINYEGILAQF